MTSKDTMKAGKPIPKNESTTSTSSSSSEPEEEMVSAMRISSNWFHQRIVKRAVPIVEAEFAQFVKKTPSLLRRPPTRQIALFHRSEICTGAELGRGASSVVYEITGFDLHPEISETLSAPQRAARKRMAETAVVDGKCQYAIKHLQPELLCRAKEFHKGACNLAVEAAFLSTLDHENILRLDGLPVEGFKAYADGMYDSFFLVTERLTETLKDRIDSWSDDPFNDDSPCAKAKIALDLAQALRYLHDLRIVFRDLKPANCGFSYNNDALKLFDFGLSRELPPSRFLENAFVMSGVGTQRYMAPEVMSQSVPYNCKADVYSWSILFWQMLSLQRPYEDMETDKEHMVHVCESGQRPPLETWTFSIPSELQTLLQDSWTGCLQKRLSIEEVCDCLAKILQQLRKAEEEGPLMLTL